MLTEPGAAPEPTAVAIVRLVCLTLVILTVLIGGGVMLLYYPQHASVAFALMGVVIGGAFGLSTRGFGRRERKSA